MIKNIEKNRNTGYLSEKSDVSYGKSIRDYLRQVDLKGSFAITLTMNTPSKSFYLNAMAAAYTAR